MKANDMFRLSFLLSNKAFFIAEKLGDIIIENEIFGDYIEYYDNLEELKNKIIKYIQNPEKRQEKTNKLYNFAKSNYDVEKNFPIEKINNFYS